MKEMEKISEGDIYTFGENIERIANALVRIAASLENIDDTYSHQYNDELEKHEIEAHKERIRNMSR